MLLDMLRYACRGLGSKADFVSATIGTLAVWWLLRFFGYTMNSGDPLLDQVTLTAASFGVAVVLVFLARLTFAPFGLLRQARRELSQFLPTKETEEKLTEFLFEGIVLLKAIRDETKPPPEEDAQKWLEDVCTYLDSAPGFGMAYVVRLNNSDGLPMMTTSVQSQIHSELEVGLRFRLARLDQFLSELRSRKAG